MCGGACVPQPRNCPISPHARDSGLVRLSGPWSARLAQGLDTHITIHTSVAPSGWLHESCGPREKEVKLHLEDDISKYKWQRGRCSGRLKWLTPWRTPPLHTPLSSPALNPFGCIPPHSPLLCLLFAPKRSGQFVGVMSWERHIFGVPIRRNGPQLYGRQTSAFGQPNELTQVHCWSCSKNGCSCRQSCPFVCQRPKLHF